MAKKTRAMPADRMSMVLPSWLELKGYRLNDLLKPVSVIFLMTDYFRDR
jgi:hypothetical protein